MSNFSNRSDSPVVITPHESMMKALLLFNHVVWPGFTWMNLDLAENWLDSVRQQYANPKDEREREYLVELERLVKRHPDLHPNVLTNCAWVRSIASVYYKKGRPIVYLYDDTYNEIIDTGTTVVHKAALTGLSVVDEKSLTMEMVEQFRSDSEAVRKYRDLRLWLNRGLDTESITEATDIIGKKIDDYEWAIKKHGLKTTTGAIHLILGSKYFSALVGGAGIGALLGGPVYATIASGMVIGAGVSAWIADQAIELKDVKRGANSEIAIIYEARNQFGS